MHPFLQNKFIRFIGIGMIVFFALFVFLIIINLTTSSTGLSGESVSYRTPSVMVNKGMSADMLVESEDSSYYAPSPTTPIADGYTSKLETYETSNYSISARTREFDKMCETLTNLKADSEIHFKSLLSSTNNCRATFYVEENVVASVLNTLTNFKGVEITRHTNSVTRHRQNIQSQTSILQQQLTSVQRSLTTAESQFDEIADFARESKDAATLSEAIRHKLQNIDSLTQRKINLTSQINRLHQQAADLEERIDVVQFDVTVNRSNPIYPNRDSQKWEGAWNDLNDTLTDTLIGLTAFFGIFILWGIKITIYLLVTLIFLRALWAVIKLLWKVQPKKTDQT